MNYTSPDTEGKGQGQGQHQDQGRQDGGQAGKVMLCLEGEGESDLDQHTPASAASSTAASPVDKVDDSHTTTTVGTASVSSDHSLRSLGNHSVRSLGNHSIRSLGNHSVRSLGNHSIRSRDSVTIGNVTWPPVKAGAGDINTPDQHLLSIHHIDSPCQYTNSPHQ